MTQRRSRIEPAPWDAIADAAARLGWPRGDLAKVCGITQSAISMYMSGKRSITPLVALRLEAALGRSAEWWLELQTSHDLAVPRRERAREFAGIRRRAGR